MSQGSGYQFPAIVPLRPPKGAPNVLVVLIDDCGFGASSAFGGPISTPNAERLAATGSSSTAFTRRPVFADASGAANRAQPSFREHGRHLRNRDVRPRLHFGAAEEQGAARHDAQAQWLLDRAVRQVSRGAGLGDEPARPFDQWPTGGGGFEYFYGFIGGETNQWYPALYEGTTPMEQGKSPEQGYHFTEDMTNKAMGWVRQQKALMPDKPFFMYFAPGATHAPHHVPKEWIDKYKGKFDGGWDKLREETFARQKKLGVIPADAVLTKRPDEIPA